MKDPAEDDEGGEPPAHTGNVPVPGSRRQRVAAKLRQGEVACGQLRALGPPDAEALFGELVKRLTHRLDGTRRPVPTNYWDKQVYEQSISRSRFFMGDTCIALRYLCKELDAARREQRLWNAGVHDLQIGQWSYEYRSPEHFAREKAEKEWRRGERLVQAYFPPLRDDEDEAVEAAFGDIGSRGFDFPPEYAKADVGCAGEDEADVAEA